MDSSQKIGHALAKLANFGIWAVGVYTMITWIV